MSAQENDQSHAAAAAETEPHSGLPDYEGGPRHEVSSKDPSAAEHVLLIEDIGSLRAIYDAYLRAAGFVTHSAETAAEGLAIFRSHPIRMVLLDLMLPDRDGDTLIAEMLELRPRTAIIVVTADRSADRAVRAMHAGAVDFLVKPIDETRLNAAIERARSSSLQAPGENPYESKAPLGEFIGTSPRMQMVYERARSAARSSAPVYLWGESGTGKELCAHAIHSSGTRGSGPFVTLDCGSLPADRLDSELFGHHSGAFPGALHDKPGAVAMADGGTLLLDNVCELPMPAQIKLLRFLETGQVKPYGATEPVTVDVRVISASANTPEETLASGKMREDLYYRLNVLSIEMPPLRSHGEDIGPIARMALDRFAAEENRCYTEITDEAIRKLERMPWPGNVRQLMNVLRAAMVMHDGPVLRAEMLPDIPTVSAQTDIAEAGATTVSTFEGMTLAEIERLVIEAAIERHDGSIPRAANELGVAPSTIYRKRESWSAQD
ncbi:MAG: sigma-54-dependent Fis family transcriptional regulator [Thioclava marina]|nr:sigma-54-dependent Fis family transcriptional regulator [Thioclava marina]